MCRISLRGLYTLVKTMKGPRKTPAPGETPWDIENRRAVSFRSLNGGSQDTTRCALIPLGRDGSVRRRAARPCRARRGSREPLDPLLGRRRDRGAVRRSQRLARLGIELEDPWLSLVHVSRVARDQVVNLRQERRDAAVDGESLEVPDGVLHLLQWSADGSDDENARMRGG